MTLYKATKDGNIPMSAEEETKVREEWSRTVVPPIPRSVTMRQARLALLNANLLSEAEAMVQNAADLGVKINWEYAQEIRRDNVLINSLGAAMGLSDVQIDNLFLAAEQIGE